MARKQSQGGSRGAKGSANKPKGKSQADRAQTQTNTKDVGKVGSDPNAAKAVGGSLDFGAREGDVVERAYTSANTKAADRGATQPHAGEFAGEGRTVGAGGVASGPGSSSGGDLDTDFVGVAGGSGLAQAAPRNVPGPDDSDGSVREFASGPPTQNAKGPKAGKIEGSTVDREGDIETLAEGRGAAAASRPSDDIDDSFRGEVSEDEAAGRDSA